MAWEVYTRQVIRTGEPTVTITKMGRLAMNMRATSLLEAENATHVVILWDSDLKKCALKLATSKEIGAYKLTYNLKSNGAGFSAVTFLNHIRYDWTETRSFNAEWDSTSKMLVFSIPEKNFGTDGNLRQVLGKVKRADRFKPNEKEATEVTS